MDTDPRLRLIGDEITAGNRVLAGYLAMIFEQGQKQRPLTQEEAEKAYELGVLQFMRESINSESHTVS